MLATLDYFQISIANRILTDSGVAGLFSRVCQLCFKGKWVHVVFINLLTKSAPRASFLFPSYNDALSRSIYTLMSFESDKAAIKEGLRVGAPTWFGIGAWGMVVGVAMIKAGLTLPQALGMTLLVFAGSAQLASLPLIAAHAPAWVIFATALVVNLRFLIFSAILAPHFAHLHWRTRAWLGFMTGDISVSLFIQRYPKFIEERGKLAYLKSLVFPNWGAWQTGSIIGILLGSQVPSSWGLGFAGTLAILCIMLPLIINRAAFAGVVVAGIVALLAVNLPYKLGLLLAVLLGMATAMMLEEYLDGKKEPATDKNNEEQS